MKTSSFTTIGKARSPLSEIQNLKPASKNKRSLGQNLALALPLTSLIDAFSIIVIYLLIGTQNSGIESTVPTSLNLPIASNSISLEKITPTLRIEKGIYKLNDEIVAPQKLVEKLSELKKMSQEKELELVVQADQEMKYQELDPLLKASSASGFEKMKFAVVPAQ